MRRFLTFIMLSLALLAGAARADLLGSLGLRSGLVELLLDQISDPGSFEVKAENVFEPNDELTTLEGVTVGDGEGVWMTVERITFQWDSSALLLGAVVISKLEIEGLTVIRPIADSAEAPEVEPVESDRGLFDWPRAPITVVVAGVKLTRISVLEGVLAQPIRFDATGFAQDEDELQVIRLDVTRTDEVAGQISLSMRRNFDDDTLALSLIADEEAGGIVAASAGFPPDAPARLRLEADGPADDWKLTFEAAVDTVFAANGQATISYAAPLSVDTAFSLQAGPALGPEAAALIGTGAELKVRMAETRPGVYQIDAGEIRSPSLTASATGQLAVSSGVSNLDVQLVAEAPLSALVPGAEFERFAFDGKVTGPTWALGADGKVELRGLRSERFDARLLALETRFSRAGDRMSLRLEGTGEALRIDKIGPEVIGPADLLVDGSYGADRIELRTASLSSAGITFAASGAYDIATSTGSGRADLSAPDIAPLAAPYGQDASGAVSANFSGEVAGDDIKARGRLALEGLRSAPVDADLLELSGNVSSDATGLGFSVSGAGRNLRLDRLTPDVLGETSLAAQGRLEGDALTLESALLASAGITLAANGRYDMASGDTALNAQLAAPDVAPIAAAYDQDARGGIDADVKLGVMGDSMNAEGGITVTGFAMAGFGAGQLRLEGRAGQVNDRLTFEVTGDGAGLLIDAVPSDLVASLSLEARGAMEDGVLTLETAKLDTPLLEATAGGTVGLDDDTIGMDYQLSTADLGPVAGAYDVSAAGSLRAGGRVTGALSAPQVTGDLSIEGARYDEMRFGAVRLAHDLLLGASPSGTIKLTTTEGPAGAVDVAAEFRSEGSELVLSSLDARALGLRATGQASANLDTLLTEGTLDLASSDLRALGRLAGTPLGGSAKGRLTLNRAEGRQGAGLNMTLSSLDIDGTRIERVDAKATGADLLDTPRVDLTADLTGVSTGDVALETLQVTARGPLAALDTTVQTVGALEDKPLTARVAGRVNAGGAVTSIRLAELEASLGEDNFRLDAPATLRVGDGFTEVRDLNLSLPEGGRIAGDAAMRGSYYAGDLTITRLSLPLLARLADVPFTAGTLDADAEFDTRRGTMDATVTGRGILHRNTRAAVGGLDLDLVATWANRQFDSEMTISGGFGEPVKARLSAPLVPAAGGLPRVADGGELDGSVKWQGQVGDLWTLVPVRGHVLDGQANVDITVAGTLRAPVVGGELTLRDGTYQNLDLGTILTDLTLDTVLRPDGGIGLELSGNDGAKGTVTATADLAPTEAGTAVDVTVDLAQAVLVRRDDVSAQISGDMAVKGPLTALDVTGALTIDVAEVRLVNASPPSIVVLDGIRMAGEEEPEPDTGGGSTVDLNITIKAPGRIFARGRGLESEWMMDLAVTGQAGAPLVAGKIERLRGTLDFLGETFDLATGRVTFDGGRRIEPRIDVALEAEGNGIVGRIVVEGPAAEPELRFTSTPSLPEDEVLPRLLFGQSKQSLTGEQALQLAAGIATLLSGSRGPLDIARDTLGVDTLRVDGLGSSSASVTVGQNLGNGVFVGARQGLGGEPGAVTVEVEVFDGITLDAEAGQEGNSSVGFTFRRDF